LVLGIFVFWRGLSLYHEYSKHSETFLLLLSFLIGLVAIIYSGMSRYPFQRQIILLLIIQILIVLIGSFIRKWTSIDTDKTKFAIYFMKILTFLTVIGVSFALLLKYIQHVFLSLFQIFVLLFTSIVGPIFKFIQYFQNLFGSKERKPTLQDSDVLTGNGNYQDQSYGITQDILTILFILGALALIIYLFYRKRVRMGTASNNRSSMVEMVEVGFISDRFSSLRKKVKPPEDLIRREIFNLEKFAHKINLGRLPFETIEEWWERVGITGSEEIIEIYSKVRYGRITFSNEDTIQISKEIRQLKNKLKEIRKKDFDKNM
jgi:hypothetical protein